MWACHCHRCNFGLICFSIFGLLMLPSRVLIQGSPINPRGYWRTNVTQFPFFQTLANPCGFTRAIPDPSSGQRGISEEGAAFTPAFLRSFYEDIKIAIDSLEALEPVFRNFESCANLSITSLPSPQSMNGANESSAMKSAYEQGIYLTAHLHLAIIDRQLGDNGRNGIPDIETRPISTDGISYLTCSTESNDMVPRMALLTTRLEAMLCRLVSQATTMERVNFRPVLQRLTSTRIYRYTSCSDLQARDCVLMRVVRGVLSILKAKFKQLLGRRPLQRPHPFTYGNRLGNEI